jgi:hypothetical protein
MPRLGKASAVGACTLAAAPGSFLSFALIGADLLARFAGLLHGVILKA